METWVQILISEKNDFHCLKKFCKWRTENFVEICGTKSFLSQKMDDWQWQKSCFLKKLTHVLNIMKIEELICSVFPRFIQVQVVFSATNFLFLALRFWHLGTAQKFVSCNIFWH
jgi:hypothetical protein